MNKFRELGVPGIFATLSIAGKNRQHNLEIRALPKDQAKKAKKVINKLIAGDQILYTNFNGQSRYS